MRKVLKNFVVYSGLAIAAAAGIAGGVKYNQYCNEYQSYPKRIQGAIIGEQRTPKGGYFIKIKTQEGVVYETGNSEDNYLKKDLFGVSLAELDEELSVGDNVNAEIRRRGTRCKEPDFSKRTTLVEIVKQ